MTAIGLQQPRSLAVPFGVSAALHAVVIVALFIAQAGETAPLPPVYRVSLVAAPPGERAAGVVNPPREAPAETPPPAQAQRPTPTQRRTAPAQQTTRATPTPPRAATAADRKPEQAAAGGGPEGGKGTDVANVDLQGLQFPYQAYLDNIVRQIALRFPDTWSRALSARVTFLIARDGSVKNATLAKRSGSFEFDTEALASIEEVSMRKAFGPLPEGYGPDVLPVTFTFDPKIFR